MRQKPQMCCPELNSSQPYTLRKARGAYDLYYLIKEKKEEKKVKFDKELMYKELEYIGRSFSLDDFMVALDEKVEYSKKLANLVFRPLQRFEEVKSAIEEWFNL